ncbi:hypothetical protein ACRALDRAFT_207905 [Sodiomyces alcalophilus JCM 7366]|uniref:uncharacterized protein n=1 Tax=Sodiomyces alcalophilus JCM 7366 TaxID=591952 RepID=UPI0039B5EE4B
MGNTQLTLLSYSCRISQASSLQVPSTTTWRTASWNLSKANTCRHASLSYSPVYSKTNRQHTDSNARRHWKFTTSIPAFFTPSSYWYRSGVRSLPQKRNIEVENSAGRPCHLPKPQALYTVLYLCVGSEQVLSDDPHYYQTGILFHRYRSTLRGTDMPKGQDRKHEGKNNVYPSVVFTNRTIGIWLGQPVRISRSPSKARVSCTAHINLSMPWLTETSEQIRRPGLSLRWTLAREQAEAGEAVASCFVVRPGSFPFLNWQRLLGREHGRRENRFAHGEITSLLHILPFTLEPLPRMNDLYRCIRKCTQQFMYSKLWLFSPSSHLRTTHKGLFRGSGSPMVIWHVVPPRMVPSLVAETSQISTETAYTCHEPARNQKLTAQQHVLVTSHLRTKKRVAPRRELRIDGRSVFSLAWSYYSHYGTVLVKAAPTVANDEDTIRHTLGKQEKKKKRRAFARGSGIFLFRLFRYPMPTVPPSVARSSNHNAHVRHASASTTGEMCLKLGLFTIRIGNGPRSSFPHKTYQLCTLYLSESEDSVEEADNSGITTSRLLSTIDVATLIVDPLPQAGLGTCRK